MQLQKKNMEWFTENQTPLNSTILTLYPCFCTMAGICMKPRMYKLAYINFNI
jgi:hypothetical protein